MQFDELDFQTYPAGSIFDERQHSIIAHQYRYSMSCFGMPFGERCWRNPDNGELDLHGYVSYLAACSVWRSNKDLMFTLDMSEALVMPSEPQDGDWEKFEWVHWRDKVYVNSQVENELVDAVQSELEQSKAISTVEKAQMNGWARHRVGWWVSRLRDASLEETDEEIAEIKSRTNDKDREFRLKFGLPKALDEEAVRTDRFSS